MINKLSMALDKEIRKEKDCAVLQDLNIKGNEFDFQTLIGKTLFYIRSDIWIFIIFENGNNADGLNCSSRLICH